MLSKRLLNISILVIIFFFGFIIGTSFFHNPEIKIKYLPITHNDSEGKNFDIYDEWKPEWDDTNVSSLIRFKEREDIIKKRIELIQYIWKGEFPYEDYPTSVEVNIEDDKYSDIVSLDTIDKIVIRMDYGVDSVAYHFKSYENSNKLIIYHEGHEGDFVLGKETIKHFLDGGYDVVAFSMPLLGKNDAPLVETEKFGYIKLADHNAFFYLESDEFSPIKFFVHPIAATLNYLEDEYDYDTIAMTGISGGGWTSVLYAAIDPRVQKSYPVAGSHPVYLLTNSLKEDYSLGADYEQLVPGLYNIANYLELYVLGSSGSGRNQIQILNKYDTCCYMGTGHLTYRDEVRDKIEELGEGNFGVFLDNFTKGHVISDMALDVIFSDI